MYYPLSSRFEGAWLGAMVGEALASNQHKPDKFKLLNYQPSQLLVRANTVAQILGNTNGLEEEQTIESNNCSSDRSHCARPLREGTPIPLTSSDLRVKTITSGEAALVFLPVILFYHESLSLMTTQIRQRGQYWHYSIPLIDHVLIWGYTIALALKGKLDVRHLVEQILVGVGESQSSVLQQLEHIKSLIAQGKDLEKVVEKLLNQSSSDEAAIALSLYCFSSTPEDFRLCISRAIATGYQTEITSALTGILAGAYNSIAGIPLDWRVVIQEMATYQQGEKQVQLLYQAWSGAYQLDANNLSRLAIASAGTIQSRSSLSIISQKDD
jgi:hypothetical protein